MLNECSRFSRRRVACGVHMLDASGAVSAGTYGIPHSTDGMWCREVDLSTARLDDVIVGGSANCAGLGEGHLWQAVVFYKLQ